MKTGGYWVVIFSCTLVLKTHAQIITTIAGNGTYGYFGDGLAATAATMTGSRGVIENGAGDIYISDGGNNVIREVNISGVITTVVGTGASGYSGDGGPASVAKLNIPEGIWLDGAGNLFIADEWNNVIRKVNASGIISTIAGTGIAGYSGDGGQATAAKLGYPTCIIGDGLGNLFIAEDGNHVVRKISTTGIITTAAGNGFGAGTPHGGYGGDGGPATAAKLNDPRSVVFDNLGNFYIADFYNNVIRKVNTLGIISTIAGNDTAGYSGDGGPAIAAKLNMPTAITIDIYGNLYIADSYNNVIRKINRLGMISTVVGNGFKAGTAYGGYTGDGGPATAAELFGPDALSINNGGDLLFCDWGNNVIRKVSSIDAGIAESTEALNSLSVIPNPTAGIVNIKGAGLVNIKVYNTTGRLIKEAGNTDNISIAGYPSGMYFIRVFSADGIPIYQSKIVKE